MNALSHPKSDGLTKLDAIKQKTERLFTLDKITQDDLESLGQLERQYIGETCTQKLQQLTGDERENFLNKIELLMTPGTKSDIWHHNHMAINNVVSEFIRQHGFMPAVNLIAAETGLSRQTINKHFKEYKKQPEFTMQMEQFQFMAPKILAQVFKNALNGDMRAARLYFEMVGSTNKQAKNTVVTAQNNYIQVNNTILSQENLDRLTADQLNQIENIVAGQKEIKRQA